MNKVFVPVKVSDRRPTEGRHYFTNNGKRWFTKNTGMFKNGSGDDPTEFWLEEREDRTAEMLEMLKKCRGYLPYCTGQREELDDLITSIEKDNESD